MSLAASTSQPYPQDSTLLAVAAYGLAGTLSELPCAPLDDASWRELLNGARLQRLTGLLVRAMDDGALVATPAQVDEATQLHVVAMTVALALEGVLVDVADLFAAEHIPFRVLKGAACSRLDYPDPSQRSFHDVDLLVPGDHLDAAVNVLVANGFRRRFPAPRPGFDAKFGKAVTLEADNGAEIDLHRTLALGPFGQRIQVQDLWDRPGTTFALGTVPMTALDADLRLVHAAYHAVLGDHPPRLMPLRDVAQLVLAGGVSAPKVLALMASWHGEAVLAHALRVAWRTLRIADMTTLSTWAEQYRTLPKDERDLSVYVSAEASFAGKSYAAVRGIPGIPDRLAYLRAMLFPQGSYVDGRHAGRLARLRHGTTDVFGKGPER